MGSAPCPTGGRDKGDGSFCEACGVYSHVEAARFRRATLLPAAPAVPPSGGTLALAVKVLLVGGVALALLSSLANRAKAPQERARPVPRAASSPVPGPERTGRRVGRVEARRAWSVHSQAEANRRLDAARESRPPEKRTTADEERRRKIQAAREGLGL